MSILRKTSAIVLAASLPLPLFAKKAPEVPLSPAAQELFKTYTSQLEALRKEVTASIPKVDEAKVKAFTAKREEWNS
ncbi:MAG: hypothetical protein HRU12_07115, partial [Phaeodactylibacter sp.]|nr:hypothetical protein [Phaeodactylibacter sp.]